MPTTSITPQSLNQRPLSVRRRVDLRVVETRHRNSSAVVVKDPIAMKYHRLSPEEYFVLEQLDRTSSLQSLCNAFDRNFAPQRVSPAEMNSLLMRLHQSGLTVSDASDQGDRLNERYRKERSVRIKQTLSNILFIRFPGIDPEPLLRRLYPLVRPLLSRAGVITALLFVTFSVIQFASNIETFWAEFPRMREWLNPESILTLAVVVGFTKVLHELGHAIACKHFGGECHCIGPMLLVFTPALYCDTSDSWMMPNRFHRALVGLGGMITEVLIASIAVLVWVNSSPGVVHVVAMNVMVVCGISTVLFNGNPLLRYDGYYVLADLCDVPNLGETSKRLLSASLGRLFLGIENHREDEFVANTRALLIGYALAAEVYRIALTIVIVWVLSLMLRPYRLDSVGYVLSAIAATGIMFALTRSPIRFFKNPVKRRQVKMSRLVMSCIVIAILVALASTPFSSTIVNTGRVQPRVESPVYVVSAGRLVEIVRTAGEQVERGDVIARLENKQTQLEATQLRGRVEVQRGVIESLKRSRVDAPEAANQLPAAEALLLDLEEQLLSRKSRLDGLTIVAPSSGLLIESPKRSAPENQILTLASWTGRPTDSENINCYLESGVEIASVMSPGQWDVEVTLSAADVERIEHANRATVILQSLPSRSITGRVVRISRMQWTPEQNIDRRDDVRATREAPSAQAKYVVRIELETNDLPLVTGAATRVRIQADSLSVINRLWRMLTSLVRFS